MQSIPRSVLENLAIHDMSSDDYYNNLAISDKMTKHEFILKLKNLKSVIENHQHEFKSDFISEHQSPLLSNYITTKRKRVSNLLEECINALFTNEYISIYSKDSLIRGCSFIDIETTGLDVFKDRIVTIQHFSLVNSLILYGLSSINPTSIFNSTNISMFIGHNLKFDYKFISRYEHLRIRSICNISCTLDTMVAENMLTNGIPGAGCSLSTCVDKYYKNIKLDKSISTSFDINATQLTPKQKEYALQDVAVLPGIILQQLLELHESGQLYAYLYIESEFVSSLAYMELTGIKIDSNAWLKVAEQNKVHMSESLSVLNDEARKNINIRKEFEDKIIQQDLFQEVKPKLKINWNSPLQVKKVLGILGHKVDCTDEKTINYLQYSEPIVSKLLNYKKYVKLCSTYGESFLSFVKNDRIYSDFIQSVSTYRLSSSKPNLQNLPATNEFRNCFVAEHKKVLIDADYSGQELRVAAEGSQDPIWVDALVSGKDLHSEIASIVFKIPIESVREKQKRFKDKSYRDVAKTINFALLYGASKFRLAAVLDISIDEADQIIKDYFVAVPKLKSYLEACAKYGLANGYIRSYAPFKAIRYLNGWNAGIRFSTNPRDMSTIESIKRDCYNTPKKYGREKFCKLLGTLTN